MLIEPKCTIKSTEEYKNAYKIINEAGLDRELSS